MSIQIQGSSGSVLAVDAGTTAARVSPRPLDVEDNGGSYSVSAITGIMAAGIAGASEILQFRWMSTTHLALIRKVHIKAGVLGTAFTAGTVLFSLTRATAFSAAGTGGGTISAATPQLKRRTSMQTSQLATLGEIRIATTAALTAGTKTLDTAPIASSITGVANTAFIPMLVGDEGKLIDAKDFAYPLTLATSEGFAIRTTVPATGTWTAHIDLEWDEVPLAAY